MRLANGFACFVLLCTAILVPVRADGQTTQATEPDTSLWPGGIRFEATYIGDAFFPWRGGISRRAAYLDNLDLLLNLDLEMLLGMRRTTLRFHAQSNRGRPISSSVGDLQGLSNIEAPTNWRLFEAWIEFNPIPGRLSLLAGVYDLNSEIDVIPAGGMLLNSSFGFGPEYSLSGPNGPSTFPFTSFGVRVKARPSRSTYLQLAVTDGAPGVPSDPERSRFELRGGEGALISWEAGLTEPAPGSALSGDPLSRIQRAVRRIGRGRTAQRLRAKLALGGWAYSRRFPTWNSGQPPGRSWGLYALAERLVASDAASLRGLSIFLRAGMANDEVNRLGAFLGAGAVCSGPISGRPDDQLGVGVAHARNGTPFMDAKAAQSQPLERAETTIELSYNLYLTTLVQLQPDLQWVINPGTDPAVGNAVVVGLRGLLTLEFP